MPDKDEVPWEATVPGPELFYPSFNYARNKEIFIHYMRGEKQTDIAAAYGLTQPTISHIIEAFRRRLTERDRELLRRDFMREYQENRISLARLRDDPAPPAFSQRGAALVDPRNDQVVEDHSTRIAAMRELAAQQARAAQLLGLDAPKEVRADTTVRYVIEGVDPESFT